MKTPCTLLLLCVAFGCGTIRNAAGERCYKRTRMLVKARFAGKMTDRYIKLYRGNYYKTYERFFGLTKITESYGRYRLSGDTIFLVPCRELPQTWKDTLAFSADRSEILVPMRHMAGAEALTVLKNRTK